MHTRHGVYDIHGNDPVTGQPWALETEVRDPAELSGLRLELIENQIAERIEDNSASVDLHRLDDMRMVADHRTRARIDRRVRELLLQRIGTRLVFDAGVHGN